jgi:hypothetical protein
MYSDEGPGIFSMVQSLEPAGRLSGKPETAYANHDLVVAARAACTKVLWAQEGEKKPSQLILIKVSASPLGLSGAGGL